MTDFTVSFKHPVVFEGVSCCVGPCAAGQTATDLVGSEELRLILVAYQAKVSTCNTPAFLFIRLSYYLSHHGNDKKRLDRPQALFTDVFLYFEGESPLWLRKKKKKRCIFRFIVLARG